MHWFEANEAPATDTENLFFALLLIKHAPRVDELKEWAKEVLTHKATFLAGGTVPDAWHASRSVKVPPIFKPMHESRSVLGTQGSIVERFLTLIIFNFRPSLTDPRIHPPFI